MKSRQLYRHVHNVCLRQNVLLECFILHANVLAALLEYVYIIIQHPVIVQISLICMPDPFIGT